MNEYMKKVLVVEDEQDLSDLLGNYLTNEGCLMTATVFSKLHSWAIMQTLRDGLTSGIM